MLRILFLDIETAPNVVYTWGLFKQNIAPSQVIEGHYVLCWAAKWLGEREMMFDSVHKSSTKHMLKGIHKLLDEADVVVHQYGAKFDIPMLNTEFVKHGMKPPSPYKQVDLKKVSSDQFRFPSSKLEYVVSALKIGKKLKEGVTFELWIRCLKGENAAWALMEKYNRRDTALLEPLYLKYLPWIKNHPNYGAFQTNKEVCPNCGGTHLQRRGFSVARLLRYPRYQCQDCGKWFKSNEALPRRKTRRYVEAG